MKLSGIGNRRHSLIIQYKDVPEDQNGYGEPIENWKDLITVNGAFEALGTREFPSYQKVHAQTTARFRIPAQKGINADKHRIVMIEDYDSSPMGISIWDIQSPTPVQGKPFEQYIEAIQIN